MRTEIVSDIVKKEISQCSTKMTRGGEGGVGAWGVYVREVVCAQVCKKLTTSVCLQAKGALSNDQKKMRGGREIDNLSQSGGRFVVVALRARVLGACVNGGGGRGGRKTVIAQRKGCRSFATRRKQKERRSAM